MTDRYILHFADPTKSECFSFAIHNPPGKKFNGENFTTVTADINLSLKVQYLSLQSRSPLSSTLQMTSVVEQVLQLSYQISIDVSQVTQRYTISKFIKECPSISKLLKLIKHYPSGSVSATKK